MQSHAQTEIEFLAPQTTLEQLLERYYDGDDAAFDQLATRLRPRLINVALGQLPRYLAGRQELAEDLATDALVKVLQTRHRTAARWQAERGPAIGWLVSIVRNLAVSRLRTKKGKEALGTDLEARTDQGRTVRFGAELTDHRLESEQRQRAAESRRQRLLWAIRSLPDELQQVLSMKLDGRTHEEIALRLGCSKSSVTRRIQTAQQTLRRELSVA